MRSLTHGVTSIRLQTLHTLTQPTPSQLFLHSHRSCCGKVEQRGEAARQRSSQSCRGRFHPNTGIITANRAKAAVASLMAKEAGAPNDPGGHVVGSVSALTEAPEKAQFCPQTNLQRLLCTATLLLSSQTE